MKRKKTKKILEFLFLKTYHDWQNYVYIRHMNVLINYDYYPEKTVHIDNQQCYTLIQSKKKRRNHFLNLFNIHFLSYAFFITTFILSICACDEPMWQSQTYKHARHFFFYFFLSLSSFLSVISIKATNDNAASSNFDWSRIFDTHTFLFLLLLWLSLSLSSASSIVCFVLPLVFFSRIQTSCLSVEFSYGCWCFWWWHKHTHCAFHHIRVSSW